MQWSFVASVERSSASAGLSFVKYFAREKIVSIEASSPFCFLMYENRLLRINCLSRNSASKNVGGKNAESFVKKVSWLVGSFVWENMLICKIKTKESKTRNLKLVTRNSKLKLALLPY